MELDVTLNVFHHFVFVVVVVLYLQIKELKKEIQQEKTRSDSTSVSHDDVCT